MLEFLFNEDAAAESNIGVFLYFKILNTYVEEICEWLLLIMAIWTIFLRKYTSQKNQLSWVVFPILLCIARFPTPDALLCIAACSTVNVLLHISVPYFMYIPYEVWLCIKTLLWLVHLQKLVIFKICHVFAMWIAMDADFCISLAYVTSGEWSSLSDSRIFQPQGG